MFPITLQRKRILDLLSQYHYLGVSHFYRFFGAQTDNQKHEVTRKLRDFVRAGLLNRHKWVDYSRPYQHFPESQFVYWFSETGWKLARQFGYRGRFNDEKSPYSLGHELAVTDFHLKLENACRKRGLELYWQQTDLKKAVRPDALFAITFPNLEPGKNTYFRFLEVEKSKQANYRDGESGLIRKLRRYNDYHRTEECKEDWKWFRDFRVVIVVQNQIRQENLLAALAEEMPSKMFWIATEDADLSQRAFLTPNDYRQTAYCLLE